MKTYITPILQMRGSALIRTTFVQNTPGGDPSMEPTDGFGVTASMGFSL